jgi:hypothetical protein
MAVKTVPTSSPRLIPAKQASAQLGVPYSTLRDAHFRGELPVVKIGKNDTHSAWYFEARDLDAWVNTRKERA